MIGDSPRFRPVDTASGRIRCRARRSRSFPSRVGSTILESVTALFVLSVALTAAVQLLASAARQLRRLEDRDRATLAASNVLERLVHAGGEMPDASQTAADGEWNWPEPTPTLANLPNARIVVQTTPATPALDNSANDNSANSKLGGQRLRVSVVGTGKPGEREVYASLTAWRFVEEPPP